jgi:hypothetical protein
VPVAVVTEVYDEPAIDLVESFLRRSVLQGGDNRAPIGAVVAGQVAGIDNGRRRIGNGFDMYDVELAATWLEDLEAARAQERRFGHKRKIKEPKNKITESKNEAALVTRYGTRSVPTIQGM